MERARAEHCHASPPVLPSPSPGISCASTVGRAEAKARVADLVQQLRVAREAKAVYGWTRVVSLLLAADAA
eukprot:11820665-Prorocentrum_lima.AAC.1